MQRRGGDQRDDADDAFDQHGPVADRPDVALAIDHLRRGARRDERVEAGDRAAGDRDEDERKHRAGEHGAAAADELRERRRLQRRIDHHHAEHEEADHADLHERAQIRARREQHPHWQRRRRDRVEPHRERHLMVREHEPVADARLRHVLPEHDRQKHHGDADDRRLGHRSLAPAEHVEAHDERQRDRDEDREGGPGALRERVDDDDAEARHRDDQHEQNGNGRRDAGKRTDFRARDVGQRSAAAPHRRPQPEGILHGAGEADAGDEPEQSRGIAELRREHGPDERTRAGDRGKVMAEEDPLRRRKVIRAVILGMRRRDARVVEHPEFRGDEGAVVPVRDDKNAEDGDDDVQGTHINRILAGAAFHK